MRRTRLTSRFPARLDVGHRVPQAVGLSTGTIVRDCFRLPPIRIASAILYHSRWLSRDCSWAEYGTTGAKLRRASSPTSACATDVGIRTYCSALRLKGWGLYEDFARISGGTAPDQLQFPLKIAPECSVSNEQKKLLIISRCRRRPMLGSKQLSEEFVAFAQARLARKPRPSLESWRGNFVSPLNNM